MLHEMNERRQLIRARSQAVFSLPKVRLRGFKQYGPVLGWQALHCPAGSSILRRQ